MKPIILSLLLCSCSSTPKEIFVSTQKQIVQFGSKIYKCSTSKFGLGNKPGSNKTPVGKFKVVKKVGEGAPPLQGFKAQVPVPRVTGRDGILSRVLVLDGLEGQNGATLARKIYLHGTPHIKDLGKPASFGCVRLNPFDIVELCSQITVGTIVTIQ